MEILDVVDENGEPTGKTVTRQQAHSEGIRHRTSHVWIIRRTSERQDINSLQVLLQKRSDNKDSHPGEWDISSAGHIPAGYSYRESAVRELSEELGVSVEESRLIDAGIIRIESDNIFHGQPFLDRQVSRVFILEMDEPEDFFTVQKEELSEVRWFGLRDVITKTGKGLMGTCLRVSELELVRKSAEYMDAFRNLNETQLRHYMEPDGGLFIAESYKVVDRALAAGCRPVCLLAEEQIKGDSEYRNVAARISDALVLTADRNCLSDITGYNFTGGMMCLMERPALREVSELIADAHLIAVLENVVNPTNIGAIFRSAAAFNVDAVILVQGCSDPLERRAIRVSMGNVFQIPWTYVDGRGNELSAETLDLLRAQGFRTAAMALRDDAIPLDSPLLKKEDKLAVVLGNEGMGLSDNTIERADHKVIIPMSHEVDSLNVAAASAVTFWELTRELSDK